MNALTTRTAGALDVTFVARAEAILAEATTAYEAKEIRDQIVTIEAWARERGAAGGAIAHARRAKMLAEMRIGEITAAMPKATKAEAASAGGKIRQGQPGNTALPGCTKQAALAEANITKMQASRWERLAALPEEEKEAVIEKEVAKTSAAAGGRATHVASNSGENEWYTPAPILDVARVALGTIDLDPASCKLANKTVGAAEFYTAKDDGLEQEWLGRVWLNPPYERKLIDRFIAKLLDEYGAGRTKAACVLVNNATDSKWFQALLTKASCVCLLAGRVRFIDKKGNPSGAPLQGQALVYLGQASKRFCGSAKSLGTCLEVV